MFTSNNIVKVRNHNFKQIIWYHLVPLKFNMEFYFHPRHSQFLAMTPITNFGSGRSLDNELC